MEDHVCPVVNHAVVYRDADFQYVFFVPLDSEATLQTTSVPTGSKRPVEEDEVDGGSVKRVKLEPSAASSTKGLTYMGNNVEDVLLIIIWDKRILVLQLSDTSETGKSLNCSLPLAVCVFACRRRSGGVHGWLLFQKWEPWSSCRDWSVLGSQSSSVSNALIA